MRHCRDPYPFHRAGALQHQERIIIKHRKLTPWQRLTAKLFNC
jgi:hypothetical protein